MPRRETSRIEINRIAAILILGAVLAACTPDGQAPETQPVITQTIIASETNVISAIAKVSQTPEASATPENSATPEPTPTPESTPTSEAVEIPDDIDWTEDLVEKENLKLGGWPGYDAIKIPIKIRPQDVHKNEPFTLLNGKYYVQVWADAWFREGVRTDGSLEEGQIYHITVPIAVFDTEENGVWKMQVPNVTVNRNESVQQFFTGPFEENFYLASMDEILCLAADGNRDCGSMDNYDITLGAKPQEFPDNNLFRLNIQNNIEFWQELMEGIYTDENIAEFEKTLDISLFSLNSEPNAPKNFTLPLRADP